MRIPFALFLLIGPALALGADEAAQGPIPIDVEEWSVWVGGPAQPSWNASRMTRNAMPGVVGTLRPQVEEKDETSKFPIAPISILQAFGDPHADVDIDVRIKKGNLLAHWPPGTERSGRVQWFKLDLNATPPVGLAPGYLPETHWFQGLRHAEGALHFKQESRTERFLAYDAEVALPLPIKIRGGPDGYTLQNLTDRPLRDVAVIAPADGGTFRVGWLDELPAAAPKTTPEEDARKAKAKEDEAHSKTEGQKAEAVFQEGEAPLKPDDTIPPLPAEADADTRAQVDQVLNRSIQIVVNQTPRKDVLDRISSQARLRFELDTKTITKADIPLDAPVTLNAPSIAARDALAEVLGEPGLSYRVTESGTLFITTAARLAEEAKKSGAVIEGPPVVLNVAPALKADAPAYREATRDTYQRRLVARGLRDETARRLIDHYGAALFEPGELIVLAHLSREALDEAVVLDVFPPPRKLTRIALVVAHGVDPRLQDRARALVEELGADNPRTRETAEARLLAMGPAAVTVLEDALKHKDVEVIFRAERLLLKLNRRVP